MFQLLDPDLVFRPHWGSLFQNTPLAAQCVLTAVYKVCAAAPGVEKVDTPAVD